MRLINADAFKDKILSGLYIYCQENKQDIADAIDSEPTFAVNCKDCDGYEVGYSAGLKDADGFTRKELESWLYAIAINNTDNELGSSCEEIIKRLDGFERYVSDMRKGVIE